MLKPHLKLVDADFPLAIENESGRESSDVNMSPTIPVNAEVAASVLSDAAVAYAPGSA